MSDDHEGPTEIVSEDEKEDNEIPEETAGEGIQQPPTQEEVVDLGAGVDKYQTVVENVFEELHLPPDVSAEAQAAWQTFIGMASSREAAGEAIYAALFDAAPSLQSLFKTARSVMALRFMNGINSIISVSDNPQSLKMQVETLGFQHLDLEVTAPRVDIFREAIVELLEMELGPRLTSKGRVGLAVILNYVGGAYIYIRREYAGRIRIIQRSWATANNKTEDDEMVAGEGLIEHQHGEQKDDGSAPKGADNAADNGVVGNANAGNNATMSALRSSMEAQGKLKTSNMKVPTTFNEMFLFNAAVMGFAESGWMNLVLEQFDAIVTNVANSYRLQEECDVLSLVLSKYLGGHIGLPEFKAVMLASLRSLVPKDWDSEHEVAWNWLWENVERMLRAHMGKPQVHEKAIERFIVGLSEESIGFLRREVYKRFFQLAPAGQDHFKQSTTRLHFIADKIIEMTVEMYKQPKRMVEDISALGLRHVGYAIPTELFSPFVSGAVDVVRLLTTDGNAEEAFRWSLTLVSKILVRTILEGSTVVMKAVNTNSEKALRKAVNVAPRGRRATDLLNITVGTQSISPLYWSIESGSLNCAKAMIDDLLTIRADRDNYYYGCDALFGRHPEIIHRLCADAPTLLPSLLDGLVWRSRIASGGLRRVNFYIKHLVQDENGYFNQALEWLADFKDPKIICHSVVVLFADIIWSRLAIYLFMMGRCYFLFMLCLFITSQAIIPRLQEGSNHTVEQDIILFVCRTLIYLGSMCKLLVSQIRLLFLDCKARNFTRILCIPVPSYLCSFQEAGNLALALTLIVMCTQEPIFYCLGTPEFQETLFTPYCPASLDKKEIYSLFSGIGILLYWALLMDFTIFSMRISAFVLVCGRILVEVGLFLMALTFFILAFATSISALRHQLEDFSGIDTGMVSLMSMALNMYPMSGYVYIKDEGWVLGAVCFFIIIISIFLMNLLIAQLNQAYQAVYEDMQGFARLNRASVIVTTIEEVNSKRWGRFLKSLNFESPLEFQEGDIGMAGGVQVAEPANANPTTVDRIKRFGGSTSPTMPWPEEEEDADEDRYDRLEKLIIRTTKNITGKKKRGTGASSSMGASGATGDSAGRSGSSQGSASAD
ncbi:unnamed protein product [Symbiodinium natans]|uniref:Globin domain-containing protein n=1 Tax=Symbiodinium natans TaxID=878477 RepID=A0A812HWP8_9DINO|nr:unnamed protein product [Symbiodinium natans]